MCNNVYSYSGKCNQYLENSIGGYDDDQSYYTGDSSANESEESNRQCTFIDSVRQGTYDDYGDIYVTSSQQYSREVKVTGGQKFCLVVIGLICMSLAMYSCYLHHSITNLLLKSLSSGFVSRKKKTYKKKVNRKTRLAKSFSSEYTEDEDSVWSNEK